MIHFFKLVSGESLVAKLVKKTRQEIVIDLPIQILEVYGDTEDGENAYTLSPWIPFAQSQTIRLNKTAIILMTAVHDDMAAEYEQRVEAYLSDDVPEAVAVEPVMKLRKECRHHWNSALPTK